MMGDIILPWFPKSVHPNFRSRSHWPRTNGLKKARGWAVLATRESSLKPPENGPIRVVLTFRPPTAHVRDKDSLLAACKAYLDGIAEAWGVNDSRFDPQPIIIADPIKGGQVIVNIVE
jgi:crossover junction endodeoxyribonuclease RusA